MLDSLQKALQEQIRDLFSAENQLVKALPKMAKNASSDTLREAIEDHLEETRGHVERLQEIAEILEFKPGGKKCKAMEGLIAEGKEVLEEDGEGAVIDLAMIGAAQRVEHYEIAAYGTARAMAERLGQSQVVKLLQATLDEEGAADKKLTEIAEDEVLGAASVATDESEEESA
ncbi:MAG: ferritin-like domain-containing protein [Phycisphaerales bacterium]|nr:ferritin-like domain-containing protein [Planctomycetota bacterium]